MLRRDGQNHGVGLRVLEAYRERWEAALALGTAHSDHGLRERSACQYALALRRSGLRLFESSKTTRTSASPHRCCS